jgi:hypothetical protein
VVPDEAGSFRFQKEMDTSPGLTAAALRLALASAGAEELRLVMPKLPPAICCVCIGLGRLLRGCIFVSVSCGKGFGLLILSSQARCSRLQIVLPPGRLLLTRQWAAWCEQTVATPQCVLFTQGRARDAGDWRKWQRPTGAI